MGSVSLVANRNTCWLRQLSRDWLPALANRLKGVERKAERDLSMFTQLLNFTDHGVKHAHKVQEKLSESIPKEMPDLLTPFQLFCLLCAALLNDVGMAVPATGQVLCAQAHGSSFENETLGFQVSSDRSAWASPSKPHLQ